MGNAQARKEERDHVALAKAFRDHLTSTGKKKGYLRVNNEREGVLVAHEMKKLGWSAEAESALMNEAGKLSSVDVVFAQQKRKRASR